MTKGVVMENPPFFFLERLPTLVRSKISSTSMRFHFEFWSMLEVIALIGTFDWSAKRTNESRRLEIILFEAFCLEAILFGAFWPLCRPAKY